MPKLPEYVQKAILSGPIPKVRNWRALPVSKMTRAEKNMAFIERYCIVPEGALQGKPIKLDIFQQAFFYAVYDNPDITTDAYLSIARKNSKTSSIALLALVHIDGPEAQVNSEIMSGARSRDQAAQVYRYASKIVMLSEVLSKRIRPIPSKKRLIGLACNVEYTASSADAVTAHGGSPIVAILDEMGQIRGPRDDFVDAVVTSQGAHDNPLLIAISTQAPTDADMFSVWLDDAKTANNPHIVAHLYAADPDCDIMDRKQWRQANPAMGKFRSEKDIKKLADKAVRMPDTENTFRNLFLNQRVSILSPFVSKLVWESCGGDVAESFGQEPVYGGLDLSSVQDLTALVLVSQHESVWHAKPTFWLPADGLIDRAKRDRVPYDRWHREGYLQTTPGKSIEYEFIADYLRVAFDTYNIKRMAFDRWNFPRLRPWLVKAEFTEEELERFVEFGQGYKSMSPAIRDLESCLLNAKIAHGNHPVLTMCAANTVVTRDPAGNRKFDKGRAYGRIDGMVSLVMALSVALEDTEEPFRSRYEDGATVITL